MTDDTRAAVAEILNRLSFVQWDRYIEQDDRIHLYGWIARPAGGTDFVLLEIQATDDGLLVGSTTSSGYHSRQISRILYHSDEEHVDCRRIEVDFDGLVDNVLRIGVPA